MAACLAVFVFPWLALSSIAAPAGSPLAYTTLKFGNAETFLTGIRGNNIVGNLRNSGWHRDRRTPLQYFDRDLDYDTRLVTGNAFIYTISSGAYQTNDFPGAVSTRPTGSGAT